MQQEEKKMDRVRLRKDTGRCNMERLAALSQEELDALTDAILQAERIYVAGFGRAGNYIKIMAMNCAQAGLKSYVVGDNATPAIQPDDLLIIGSGSGETKTMVLIAEQCKTHGAKLALISANTNSTIGKLADINVEIPSQDSPEESVEEYFSKGSFYHLMAMVCDCVLAYVLDASNLSVQDVYDNHNNLE
jgi:6-phospho-3-hexuloisomerase